MRRTVALHLFRAWEAALFFAAVAMALTTTSGFGFGELKRIDIAFLVALAILWLWLIQSLGLYRSRRLASRAEEVVLLTGAVTVATAGLALIGILTDIPFDSRRFLGLFWLSLMIGAVGGRLAVRTLLWTLRRSGRNLRYVAVVGAGRRGRELARRIGEQPGLGYRLRGFVDDSQTLAKLPAAYPVIGDLDALAAVLVHEPVDEVLIALPMRSGYDRVSETLRLCERLGVPARMFTDLFDLDASKTRIERFGDGFSLTVFNGPSPGPTMTLKRLFDIVASAAGLLVLSPLLIAIAVAVRLDSPGPALFVQKRIGLGRRAFDLFKFRTMVADAERRHAELEALNEASGPVFKIRHDPRITPLGRFLRRYSLDELPQLLNVLRGEMSIVGPRPLPLRDVERFEHDWHVRRFSVRPGLTCSWVLSGRSNLDFDAWVRHDLDYIDTWSFWKDLRILFKTIPIVVRGSGAY